MILIERALHAAILRQSANRRPLILVAVLMLAERVQQESLRVSTPMLGGRRRVLLLLALMVLPVPVFLLLISERFYGNPGCDCRAVSDEAHAVLEVTVKVLQRSADHAHWIACKLPAFLVKR